MPVNRCQLNNKPGYKWGDSGKCYTYVPGNRSSETKAKDKAVKQGIAIGEFLRETLRKIRDLCVA